MKPSPLQSVLMQVDAIGTTCVAYTVADLSCDFRLQRFVGHDRPRWPWQRSIASAAARAMEVRDRWLEEAVQREQIEGRAMELVS